MADITLPQLGETVTEGTITRWFKQVGDSVAADEALFEVSTDKVDTEVPSPSAGVLTEIRVQEGDTVPVGAVIAVVGSSNGAAPSALPAVDAQPPAVAADAEPADAAAAAPPPTAPSASSAPASSAPASSAPAPATLEPEPASEAAGAPAPPPAGPASPTVLAPMPATAPRPPVGPVDPSDRGSAPSDNRLLSPVVRRLVAEHGIDPRDLTGSGPGGRITREDVLDHIDTMTSAETTTTAQSAPAPQSAPTTPSAPMARTEPTPPPRQAAPAPPPQSSSPSPSPGGHDTVVALSKIRRLTGDHMVTSLRTSPHAFSVVEVDFANVDRTRKAVKDEFRATEGFSLTALSFISRAIVDALREFPHLNATVDGDNLIVHNVVDLGIAVDLAYSGLLVPVVRSAETKRLRAIAQEINDLASRAKSRRLSPDEISGGTFTISNNGSAGSVLTMAIINQPQVAILSTDAVVRKPVVVALPDGSESIAIHPVGNLAMSWDHRAFDGAYAAGFLGKVKQLLETRDWDAEL